MTTAVGYIRVSTAEQAESGLGLDAQRRRIEGYAMSIAADLSDVLEDAGESGKDTKRPGCQELLARVNGGLVDLVIIARLDRLTRSVRDLGDLLDALGKARRADGARGVGLASCEESIDTTTATGQLVINILGAVSQWERQVISERTRSALAARRASGRRAGNVPYGYQAGPEGVLTPDPEEQRVLEEVREHLALGESYERIANSLTAQGRRTRRGGSFSRQGLFQLARRAGLK